MIDLRPLYDPAKAEAAFYVMMRHPRWVVSRMDGGSWRVFDDYGETSVMEDWATSGFADPFTALVEADKWMKEREAAHGS